MDMERRVWSVVQTLEKQPLGTCAYVLLLSHNTRACKNKARGVVERKVAGLIPERMVLLFTSWGVDCTMQYTYYNACRVQIG